MRINLVDREQNKRGRRKPRRRRKGRRSRTFDAAIASPRSQRRQRAGKRRTSPGERGARLWAQSEQSESKIRRPVWKGIRWRVLWLRLPAFLILVALIGAIAYTSVDARFFVYDAQITGSRYIKREHIYERAGVDEQNIFWIRSKKVAQRIAQIPGIKAVRVHCRLPALVTITVEERNPVVMWRTWAHGQDWWLDEEGLVLPYGGDTDSAEPIYVVDSSQRQLQEGARIEPPEIVQWVRQLAAELPDARVFYYQADRGLYFVQERDGYDWRVYIGDGENLQTKILATQALTDYMVANNIHPSYIDVRWPELPIYGQANSGGNVGGGD